MSSEINSTSPDPGQWDDSAPPEVPNTPRDRARGALLGLACGDAVGTTLEFKRPGTFEPIDDMVGGGPFNLEPGEWTDDTTMALCMAESILDMAQLDMAVLKMAVMDLADHHRRYLLWRDHGYFSVKGRCFDIGGTTSSQLRRFETTGIPIDPNPDDNSAANGSLMRLAPAPIVWRHDLAEAAERSGESSRSTHAADRPVDACRLFGAMLAALIEGMPFDQVTAPEFWEWGNLHPQIAAIADGSYRRKEPPQIRGTGFCVDALEAALWAVNGAESFREAVLRAANLGDDADTTAAIAGQLAGARWGAEAIPAEWREKVSMHDRILSIADNLFDLGSALHAAADDTAADRRWLLDHAHHAWWVEPGLVMAGEYPLSKFGGEEKLDLLMDAGVRTFIDLTTPEDELRPYRDELLDRARKRGIDVRHESHPIPDLGVVELDAYRDIVDLIAAENAAGRAVYIHCWGGIGRTGTVVGCHLVERHDGDEPPTVTDILEQISELRAGTKKDHRLAPETPDQRAKIAEWIEVHGPRSVTD